MFPVIGIIILLVIAVILYRRYKNPTFKLIAHDGRALKITDKFTMVPKSSGTNVTLGWWSAITVNGKVPFFSSSDPKLSIGVSGPDASKTPAGLTHLRYDGGKNRLLVYAHNRILVSTDPPSLDFERDKPDRKWTLVKNSIFSW